MKRRAGPGPIGFSHTNGEHWDIPDISREAGGTGTDWFLEHQRELLGNAEFLVNEGGENLLEAGKVKYVGVDVGEKTTFWLHVVARGRPGPRQRPISQPGPKGL